MTSSHVVSVPELAAELEGPSAPRLFDVRWTLTEPNGYHAYLEGHLPAARYVDMDTELASTSLHDPTLGRHPLPTAAEFEATVRSWGVELATPIVLYDDNAGLAAARAWWLLQWAGFESVRILDGGLAAWRKAMQPLSRLEPDVTASQVTIRPGSRQVVTADEALTLADTAVLLDARAPERYRGDHEPMDAQAGHIPGARNAPAGSNVAEGRFLPLDQLRSTYAAHGVFDAEVGVYCGSGITACHDVFVLDMLGVSAALYPPSWSGWTADPQRPISTGD